MTQDRKMEVQTMNQVYRCYTEKREGFQVEAGKLLQDLKEQLGHCRAHPAADSLPL